MLKQSAAFVLAAIVLASLSLSSASAETGDQDLSFPAFGSATSDVRLPNSPCNDNDAACAAFVAGQATPVAGISSSIWREAQCLAVMAFHEARSEGPIGMKAVIWVALNRAQASNISLCRIVTAPGQFSSAVRRHLMHAVRTGTMPRPIRLPSNATADIEALAWARGLAWRTLMGELTLDPTEGATFFHAASVRPDWANQFVMTVQIGAHRFYRPPDPS